MHVPMNASRPDHCASTSSLNARQRKQVYMYSSIFENGGPSTNSKFVPMHQENIYQHIRNHPSKFSPQLQILSPADLRQTQNSGHNVVFPSRRTSKSLNETYDPLHHGRNGESIQVVHAKHEQTSAIPREQWACPDMFNKTQEGDTRTGWKDTRNELARGHRSERENESARDLKHYELSSSLFNNTRMQAKPRENDSELLCSNVHFLSEDSSMNRKEANIPPSAEKRFHENLMVSENNYALPTTQDMAHGSSPHVLDEPENPRRRNEKNFSDIFGQSTDTPKKIVTRGESSNNCNWLDAKMEISYRNKNPRAALPNDPHDRKAVELTSSVFPARLPHWGDSAIQDKADAARKEKATMVTNRQASAFGRKQLNLSSSSLREIVTGKKAHSDMRDIMTHDSVPVPSGPSVVVSAPYAWPDQVKQGIIPKELKRLSLEGSGSILR